MTRALPKRLPLLLSALVACIVASSCRQAPKPVGVTKLTQEVQTPVTATYNPNTGRPSFIRGRIPITVIPGVTAGDTSRAPAYALMRHYASVFGTDSTGTDLRFVETRNDAIGMRHTVMQQVYQGVDVYAATVTVHQIRSDGVIAAVTSNVVPDVHVATTQAALTADSARAIAAKQLPHGVGGVGPSGGVPGPAPASPRPSSPGSWKSATTRFRPARTTSSTPATGNSWMCWTGSTRRAIARPTAPTTAPRCPARCAAAKVPDRRAMSTSITRTTSSARPTTTTRPPTDATATTTPAPR